MRVSTAKIIADDVGTWPGVTIRDNGRSGMQFLYGTAELGHMHGNHVAHLPMPKITRNELIEKGRATAHPARPDSGWIQVLIRSSVDAEDVLDLFRMNYERTSNGSQISTRSA